MEATTSQCKVYEAIDLFSSFDVINAFIEYVVSHGSGYFKFSIANNTDSLLKEVDVVIDQSNYFNNKIIDQFFIKIVDLRPNSSQIVIIHIPTSLILGSRFLIKVHVKNIIINIQEISFQNTKKDRALSGGSENEFLDSYSIISDPLLLKWTFLFEQINTDDPNVKQIIKSCCCLKHEIILKNLSLKGLEYLNDLCMFDLNSKIDILLKSLLENTYIAIFDNKDHNPSLRGLIIATNSLEIFGLIKDTFQ